MILVDSYNEVLVDTPSYKITDNLLFDHQDEFI